MKDPPLLLTVYQQNMDTDLYNGNMVTNTGISVRESSRYIYY